jgi:hypothetical protein
MKKTITKLKKAKRNNLVLLCAVLLLASCQAGSQIKMRIDMPRKSAINLDNFGEIIVTDFLVKEDAKDFVISEELVDYFITELGQNLDKKISSRTIAVQDDGIFDNENFWKDRFADQKDALLLTGSAEYTQEVRKAIKSAEKRRFETPFPDESRIEERRFYSLSLQLFLIDPKSGETLFKRTFKENKSYQNPNQTGYFAFYDLMMTIKDKLFRQLLGEKQIQERYLIK